MLCSVMRPDIYARFIKGLTKAYTLWLFYGQMFVPKTSLLCYKSAICTTFFHLEDDSDIIIITICNIN